FYSTQLDRPVGYQAGCFYLPAYNFQGTDTLTYVVNDGVTDSAPATITFDVTPQRLPVANPQTVNTLEDQPVNITLTGSDPRFGNMFYRLSSYPAYGTISGTAPNITYTPPSNFVGTVTFTFQAAADVRASDPATVTINVNRVSHPPTATPQQLSILSGGVLG